MQSFPPDDRRADIPVWLGALLVATLWLLARPYVGLRHDGVLYLGQALLHIVPQTMSRDVFFAYGSQDSFSVVSTVLAGLYQRWGVDVVQIVVPSACHVALLAVAYRLLKPLPVAERWLGLVALALLSHVYGGRAIFAFAERFLTARTLAEPLVLAALVALLNRRGWLAGLCIVAAAAVHPLVALPGLAIGWVLLCHVDRRWTWAGLLVLAPLTLAAAGVSPFAALFDRYDDAWWAVTQRYNGQVLLSVWKGVDWQIVGLDLAVLAAATRLLPVAPARLARATIFATLGLLLVSWLGADVSRNVLLTQLQVWRVLWLTHMLSLLFLPALGLWCWRQGVAGRLSALALAATVVAVNSFWEGGWVFFLWTVGSALLMRTGAPMSAAVQRVAIWSTGVALAGLSTAVVARTAGMLIGPDEVLSVPTASLLIFTLPTLAFPAAFGVLWAWRRGRALAAAALLLLALSAVFGATQWDRRNAWVRHLETGLNQEHPFAHLIPPLAQVYWHENPAATWLLLKRASYVSVDQGAGVLFSRRTAMEFQRRRDGFAALQMQTEVCRTMAALNREERDRHDCVPTEEVLGMLCAMSQGPDYMIFERRLSTGLVASWTFSAPGYGQRSYHLYDCRQIH